MTKRNKQGAKAVNANQSSKSHGTVKKSSHCNCPNYLYSMSMAPNIDQSMHWFQLIPAVIFTSVVIMIVRMYQYTRPMNQFYWSNSGNDVVEFFSYYKMITIIICATLALLFLLYRAFTQSFFIKRSVYYIPMLIYTLFVLLSFCMSDYKEFALWGWNDRFEGTFTLIAYMILLFYVINSVNDEKNVKYIIYPTAIVSILLSLLGLTQAFDCDFFQTTLGKKLITPSWFWNQLDNLTFRFQNHEIYQTVYNINYVSFYLTLLIPLFGLLFIYSIMKGKDETIGKKLLWGILFGLNMYNLIGSQSSGGFLGMAAVGLLAIILLNKELIKWIKPLALLLIITILIGGLTFDRWLPELTNAADSVLNIDNKTSQELSVNSATNNPSIVDLTKLNNKIDYIKTDGNDIIISYAGNKITFTTYPLNPLAIKLVDNAGKDINITPIEGANNSFTIADERFSSFIIGFARDSLGINYFIIKIDHREWPFAILKNSDVTYRNDLGKFVSLDKVEAFGWENNQSFGSGRGYIWSRTIPMMKETLFIGYGPDTFCLYFPHNDYVGKYNANWDNINTIVDKPHNLYMGAWIGTGGLSVLSLLILWFMYVIQSIKIFWKRNVNKFIEYAGLGIFLGICGFLVSGLVNDSTVSVMPMFYGLLGTGISINMMLERQA